ncbi:MAG: MBL fold metallo-hydrolase [Pseudolabrys sp.]
MHTVTERPLEFPHSPYPAPGELRELADGLFWARVPLPFQLNHVNVWIIDDGDGWAIVDSGVNDPPTLELWTAMLSGFLAGRPIRRVIATHGHTDHVGIAEFLRSRNDAQFEATAIEWMSARMRYTDHQANDISALKGYLRRHGGGSVAEDAFEQERKRVQRYLGPQPANVLRLAAGQELKLGGRSWRVITGGGHADEHASFYCKTDRLLIAGDQILPRISPSITVAPGMPEADPLLDYFVSLAELRRLPDDVLVLPGHGDPFYGLRSRIMQLVAHHHSRLDDLAGFIREPLNSFSATELLFPKAFTSGQGRLAFGETIAHLHRLVGLERAEASTDDKGEVTFVARG